MNFTLRQTGESKTYTLTFYLLFTGFSMYVLALLWAYYQGEDLAIDWSKLGIFEALSIPFESFEKDFFNFFIESQTHIFVEQYISDPIHVSSFAHMGQLLSISLCLIIFSACLSEFRKVAYFLGLGFLFFTFSNLNLESLGLLTYDHLRYLFPNLSIPYFDKTLTLLIIILYGLTTYYFKVFASGTSFSLRLLVFTIYTGAVAVFIFNYAPYTNPHLFLNSYGTFIPLVALLIVCLVCGYEIVRGFINIITVYNERGAGKNLGHLLVIFVLYFANLFLLYLVEIKSKTLGLYYLPYTLVASVSFILGIWGLKVLRYHYRHFLSLETARLVYLSLAILGLSGLFTAYTTANDLLIRVYKEVIIYTHLALSLGFILYVIGNFYRELLNNTKIPHLFRPQVLSVPSIWGLGMTALLIYSIFNNKTLFIQQKIWGAYFNTLGFAHYHNDETLLAKQYYNLAIQYIPANHHASYALGMMARAEKDDYAAQHFFGRTEFFHPSPYNSIQIADILEKRQSYFKALFSLQHAQQKFKHHPQINNNLALLYNKINISDSVFFYFRLAEKYSSDPTIPANTFALWIKYDSFNIDVLDLYKTNQTIEVTANRLAYMNKYQKYHDESTFLLDLNDSILNASSFCYLYNYVYNHLDKLDSSIYDFALKASQVYENRVYVEYLTYVLALVHYKQQDVKQAFYFLQKAVQHAGTRSTYYSNQLGIWYLKFGKYDEAIHSFRQALQRGYEPARFYLAFTLTKTGHITKAVAHWQKLETAQNLDYQVFASRMLDIFTRFSLTQILDSDDFLKYHYLIYNNIQPRTKPWEAVFETLQLPDVKAKVLLHSIENKLPKTDKQMVDSWLKMIDSYKLAPQTRQAFILTKLFYFLNNSILPPNFTELVNSLDFKDEKQGWPYYFQAIDYQQRKDYDKALASFQTSLKMLPFETKPYQSLAHLYQQLDRQDEAYHLILEAVKLNPNNTTLLITYFQICLELNYLNFAKDVLETLGERLSAEDYRQYLRAYQKTEIDLFEEINE